MSELLAWLTAVPQAASCAEPVETAALAKSIEMLLATMEPDADATTAGRASRSNGRPVRSRN
jgi:hypothetical protein